MVISVNYRQAPEHKFPAAAEDAVPWSESEAYAMRLRAAGVATTFTRYSGVTHEFFSMSAALEQARMAVAEAAAAIKAAAPSGKG